MSRIMKKTILLAAILLPCHVFAQTAFDGVQGLISGSDGQKYDPATRIVEVSSGVWKRVTKDGKIDDSTVEIYNGVWVTKKANRGNTSNLDTTPTNNTGSQQAARPSSITGSAPAQSQQGDQQQSYTNGSVKMTRSPSNFTSSSSQDLSGLINYR